MKFPYIYTSTHKLAFTLDDNDLIIDASQRFSIGDVLVITDEFTVANRTLTLTPTGQYNIRFKIYNNSFYSVLTSSDTIIGTTKDDILLAVVTDLSIAEVVHSSFGNNIIQDSENVNNFYEVQIKNGQVKTEPYIPSNFYNATGDVITPDVALFNQLIETLSAKIGILETEHSTTTGLHRIQDETTGVFYKIVIDDGELIIEEVV